MNILHRLLEMNRSEIVDTLEAVVTLNLTQLGDFELPSINGKTIQGLSPALTTNWIHGFKLYLVLAVMLLSRAGPLVHGR